MLEDVPLSPVGTPPCRMTSVADRFCVCERVSSGWGGALVVFSGGSAFNEASNLLKGYQELSVTHVLPVSDDGGSSAEVIRALGGPAVGDIRSRCLRLAEESSRESVAVKDLLAHRIGKDCPKDAKLEWKRIVEGNHELWNDVSKPYKLTILAFLSNFQTQIQDQYFDFRNGSIGNFFFAGARTFFRSLESAIFVFSRVARIPEGSAVLPVILSEERITLSAELEDGQIIHGQNEISHPTGKEPWCTDADGYLSGRIRRVFYSSMTKAPLEANPSVISKLANCDAIVYAMGSLFTSIIPNLLLAGMKSVISVRSVPKILLLNGSYDRETKWSDGFMTASDFVRAVTDALNSSGGNEEPPTTFVTVVIAPEDGEVIVDENQLNKMGIHNIMRVPSIKTPTGVIYQNEKLVSILRDLTVL